MGEDMRDITAFALGLLVGLSLATITLLVVVLLALVGA